MKFKFDLYQSVYHVTPESEKGIILSRRTYPDLNRKEYLVAVGFNNEMWCIEEELTTERIFV